MNKDTTPYEQPCRDTLPAGPLPHGSIGSDPFPGEFRLVRRLGGGTFGEVWLADDLSPLRRQVALKFLRGQGDRLDKARTALEQEAGVVGSLRHPNIVVVHSWKIVAASGMPCLVMQYVEGGSLEARVERDGPLPWEVAARYIVDAADGLLRVHRRDIIHRDIKPANLLWQHEDDEALLTDFGIAARLADPQNIAGTPRFMAPEAFRGETSAALDIYGLAASLFWLTTGQPPFPGSTVKELVPNIERGLPAVDARFAGVPEPLEHLIRAGLAPQPTARPRLEEFVKHLRGTLNGLLADRLTLPGPEVVSAGAPVNLKILVSRQSASGFEAVAANVQTVTLRDLQRVPRSPDKVTLRTGDRVRLEVVADQAGYVVVFNVGPTGNLNLLYPETPEQATPLLRANQVLRVLDVVMTPPAGRERVFVLWTRQPLPLRLAELASLVGQENAVAATRDMTRVRQSLDALPACDKHAVVLELEHR